jgi:hypothetical protein
VRNNMGVGGIELQVRGSVQGNEVVFADTGQRLLLRGAPPASTAPWLVFSVHGWQAGSPLELELLRAQAAPGKP